MTAAKLKSDGNELFKAGKLAQAAQLYAKAEEADPKDPVYPSNLSAALYEIANYPACAEVVLRSWKLLKESSAARPDLIARLSTRLAKCLSHGLLSGAISDTFVNERAGDILQLRDASLENVNPEPTSPELLKAWKLWVDVNRADCESREAWATDAMKRFLDLPHRRQAQIENKEFFKVGHDDIFSILEGWSPQDRYPLNLHTLPASRLANISLLFGGVGDARHVFGTLVDLQSVYEKLGKAKRKALHVHVTMLDHHPGMLARDLCVLMLLDQLMDDKLDSTTRLELEATVAYTYSGILLPPYCATRLYKVIENLVYLLTKSPSDLPQWLHITSSSLAPIAEILSLWLDAKRDPAAKDTAYLLRRYSWRPMSMDEHAQQMDALAQYDKTSSVAQLWASKREEKRASVGRFIDTCGVNILSRMGVVSPNASPAEVERARKDNREMLIEMYFKVQSAYEDYNHPLEETWFSKMKVFLPPKELWERHPGFKELMQQLASGKDMNPERVKQATKDIRSKWKPNPTLFYREYFLDGSSPEAFQEDFDWPPFDFAEQVDRFFESRNPNSAQNVTKLKAGPTNWTTLNAVTKLFRAVAQSLKLLGSHVKIEVLCGSLNEEVAKMRLKSDTERPEKFPRLYTRMWLSNVPDYTNGLLTTAVYVLPGLEQSPEAACAWNSLLATGAWKDADHFNYNYSFLTFAEIPRYLGWKVIHADPVFGTVSIGQNPFPRPLSELATRQELTTWLNRALMQILRPGMTPPPPVRIMLPNNVNAFIALLIYLHQVGFPGHWLAEYLQDILSGGIVTDVVPYEGFYPMPLEEKYKRMSPRRIRLDGWLVDIENAIANVYDALPFAVTIPSGISCTPSDIVLWKARLVPVDIMNMMSRFLEPVHSVFDPVMNLLVFKLPESETSVLGRYKGIFEGAQKPRPGTFFFITAIEFFDMENTREMRWRMSKERVNRMKEDKWFVIPWRSDCFMPIAEEVPIQQWVEIP